MEKVAQEVLGEQGGSEACVYVLAALHLMLHKALGYSGLGTRRGPDNQNCSSGYEHSVLCQHVKKH